MIRRQDPAIGDGGTDLGVTPSAITALTINFLPMYEDPEGVTKTQEGASVTSGKN